VGHSSADDAGAGTGDGNRDVVFGRFTQEFRDLNIGPRRNEGRGSASTKIAGIVEVRL
jgi:hypothetical protein